jgi:hypothetical protein
LTIRFLMDVHVPRAITDGLRRRGVEVITAQEDGSGQIPDAALLDRAHELGAVLVTCDVDFLSEARDRRLLGRHFASILFAHQQGIDIGGCVDDLALFATAATPAECRDQVFYLPLR